MPGADRSERICAGWLFAIESRRHHSRRRPRNSRAARRQRISCASSWPRSRRGTDPRRRPRNSRSGLWRHFVAMTEGHRQGTVYLVGAGPGDPELITLKGQRVLASADSILYDHLAPHALLDLAPRAAERIYVGKKATERAYEQEEISAMLVDRARRGLTVVRLKGGDPFIFGRGGE